MRGLDLVVGVLYLVLRLLKIGEKNYDAIYKNLL